MSRFTRRDLKQDAFRTAFEDYEAYLQERWREIVVVVLLVVVVVGASLGLRQYIERVNADANAELALALDTYRAYVGTAPEGLLGPNAVTFPTAEAKYQKALAAFTAASELKGFRKLLPTPKPVRLARYHVGLCQMQLGRDADAIKTFEQVSHDRDADISALARFALAGEYVKTGKVDEAVKIYQSLADSKNPANTVPRTTVLLAEADALRATQPARARQIYTDLEREYAGDPTLAGVVKDQLASLPQ